MGRLVVRCNAADESTLVECDEVDANFVGFAPVSFPEQPRRSPKQMRVIKQRGIMADGCVRAGDASDAQRYLHARNIDRCDCHGAPAGRGGSQGEIVSEIWLSRAFLRSARNSQSLRPGKRSPRIHARARGLEADL
jgi:hypothetical protein